MDIGDITYTDLDGIDGCYVGGRIFVQKNLPYRVKRCVELHERVHSYLRHEPMPPGPEYHAREQLVDQITARELISFPMLLEGLTEHTTMEDLSRVWGVDMGTICARMLTLTPEEQVIVDLCGFRCTQAA